MVRGICFKRYISVLGMITVLGGINEINYIHH